MEPGIYNIPFDQYLSLDRVSNSYLSRLSKVPAMAKIKTEATPAMTFGTAFHSFILEPDKFSHQVAVCPKCDRRTKAGKEVYADFTAESTGKVVISIDEFETIQSMRESISRHPAAARLLSGGIAEQSVLFNLESNNGTIIKCKARTDFLTPNGIVVDLKTTKDASQHSFLRSILNFKYYLQASFYMTGLSKISDKYERFIFIAIEPNPPFRCEVYELSDEFLEYGYFKIKDLLELELKCRGYDFWPNYQNDDITIIEKPNYLGYP